MKDRDQLAQSLQKEWKMFPTVLAYYEINFALKDTFQSSLNPKTGLYVAVLLVYLCCGKQC